MAQVREADEARVLQMELQSLREEWALTTKMDGSQEAKESFESLKLEVNRLRKHQELSGTYKKEYDRSARRTCACTTLGFKATNFCVGL